MPRECDDGVLNEDGVTGIPDSMMKEDDDEIEIVCLFVFMTTSVNKIRHLLTSYLCLHFGANIHKPGFKPYQPHLTDKTSPLQPRQSCSLLPGCLG
jgi:hypothetical protein